METGLVSPQILSVDTKSIKDPDKKMAKEAAKIAGNFVADDEYLSGRTLARANKIYREEVSRSDPDITQG